MHTVLHFLTPFQDPLYTESYTDFRNRILGGDLDPLKKLFDLIALTGASIPSTLDKDRVLFDKIQSRIGSDWVHLATQSSFEFQITQQNGSSVWQNRKFALLKMDMEEDKKVFIQSLEVYLSEEGFEGLKKVFQDAEMRAFLTHNSQEWVLSVLKRFPGAQEAIEMQFGISLDLAALEIIKKRRVLDSLVDNLLRSPQQTASLLIGYLRKTAGEGLDDLFRDKEILSLLFHGEEYPWVGELLVEFPQAWEKIEDQVSKIWLTNPHLDQLLEKEDDWLKALKKGASHFTPFLFLAKYSKGGDILYEELDPDLVHKIFLQECYHPILHCDAHYPWIPFYLFHFPKNVQLVEAFVAKKWKDDPKLYQIVQNSYDWLEALEGTIRFSQEPSVFLFLIDFIRQKINLQGFSPEKIRKFYLYLPDWILAKFGRACYYSDSCATFSAIIHDLCAKTNNKTLEEKALSMLWYKLVKYLQPVALIELSKMEPAHQLAANWVPFMDSIRLKMFIPLLEPAPFKTIFNELTLEEHPKALQYATEKQKEFYANVFAYAVDHDCKNFLSGEMRTDDAVTEFLQKKRNALESILGLYKKKPENIVQCLSFMGAKFPFEEGKISPLVFNEMERARVLHEVNSDPLLGSQKALLGSNLESKECCSSFDDYNLSTSETLRANFMSSKETVILSKGSIPRLAIERIKRDS